MSISTEETTYRTIVQTVKNLPAVMVGKTIFRFGYSLLPDSWKENYVQLNNSEWFRNNSFGANRDILDFLSYNSTDTALPQWFFNQYMDKFGERPYGVWSYDKEKVENYHSGEFVSWNSIEKELEEKLLETVKNNS